MPAQAVTRLVFDAPSPAPARKHFVCGLQDALLSDAVSNLLPLGLSRRRFRYLVDLAAIDAGVDGAKANWMFTASDGKPSTIVVAVLPAECSRHASPVRPHALTALLKDSKSADVLMVLEDASHAGGAACAIGRAFPTYSAKTRPAGGDMAEQTIHVSFATRDGPLGGGYSKYAAAAAAVRRAARLVDLPPDALTPSAFVKEARAAAERLGAAGFDVQMAIPLWELNHASPMCA
jgi:probable aminopeptidase NPEPL1